MPISSRTRIAWGRMGAGEDPAEEMTRCAGARDRAIPSAIWLRAEFATQRNRMCRGGNAPSSAASVLQSPGGALITYHFTRSGNRRSIPRPYAEFSGIL